MNYIERPKKVNKSEQSVQDNKYLQKNMQGQINTIYDYLDKLANSIDGLDNTEVNETIQQLQSAVSDLQDSIEAQNELNGSIPGFIRVIN